MSGTPYRGRATDAGNSPVSPVSGQSDSAAFDSLPTDPTPAAPPDETRAPTGPAHEHPLLGGRYALLDRLGSGRRTFRAHDRVLDRDVVVKIVSGGDEADARQRAQVLGEARAAGRVVHPNVATVLDVVEDGDTIYMVSELAEGHPLPAMIRERGRFGPAEAVEIATQIADTLAAAHEQHVVHGALTSDSILVTSDNIARLVDLGSARVAHATQQIAGASADPRTDVYALGAVLYEILTGEPPVSEPREPSRRNPSVPPDLDEIVLTALAPDPDRRYQSLAALRDALRQVGKRSINDTQVMRRPVLPRRGEESVRRRESTPPLVVPRPPLPAPEAASRRADSHPGHGWATAGRSPRGRTSGKPTGAPAPFSRRLLWIGGAVAALTLLALAVTLFSPFGGQSSDATERWATFSKPSCQWSNVTTPPGICFGERPAGYRVRVLEQKGSRWMVWDPATQGQAYVDSNALKPD